MPELRSLAIMNWYWWNEDLLEDMLAIKRLNRLCLLNIEGFPGTWLSRYHEWPDLGELEIDDCREFEDRDIARLGNIARLRRLKLWRCSRLFALPLDQLDVSGLNYLQPLAKKDKQIICRAFPNTMIAFST